MKRIGSLFSLLIALALTPAFAQAPAVQSDTDISALVPLFGTANTVKVILPGDATRVSLAAVHDSELVLEASRSVEQQEATGQVATLTGAAMGHINKCPLQVLLNVRIQSLDELSRGQQQNFTCIDGEYGSVSRTGGFASDFFAPIPREVELDTWHLFEAADIQLAQSEPGEGASETLSFYFYVSSDGAAPPAPPGLLEELPGESL